MRPTRIEIVEAMLPGVVAYELWGTGDASWLLDPEPSLVDRAVGGRVAQFAAGRRCARLAMVDIGVQPLPIMRSLQRAPAWPAGLYGSISHTEGYAIAAVGRSDGNVSSIGIDAERSGRVDESLHRRLFVDEEREWLGSLTADERDEAATAMFGIKESFYKAQFPLTGAWVGFHDVRVECSGELWTLTPATDLAALAAVRWPCHGRSIVRRGIVVTTVAVSGDGDR